MPKYFKVDNGYTIGPGATQYWTWNWFGSGPNQGPIIFMADPKSGQTHRVKLVTSNLAKCRGGPSEPNGNEVFYEFTIRNESQITAAFSLEMINFKDLM